MLDNTFARAAFTVTLLSGSIYIWYTIQHYAIGIGYAISLIWEHLKSSFQSYFKPLDYAYYMQIALLHCK